MWALGLVISMDKFWWSIMVYFLYASYRVARGFASCLISSNMKPIFFFLSLWLSTLSCSSVQESPLEMNVIVLGLELLRFPQVPRCNGSALHNALWDQFAPFPVSSPILSFVAELSCNVCFYRNIGRDSLESLFESRYMPIAKLNTCEKLVSMIPRSWLLVSEHYKRKQLLTAETQFRQVSFPFLL